MSLPCLSNKTTLYQISLLFMEALRCTGKFALTVSINGESGDFHSHHLTKEDSATGKCKYIHSKQSKTGIGKPFLKVQIRKKVSGKTNSEQRTMHPVGDKLNAEFGILANTEIYQLCSSTMGASHDGSNLPLALSHLAQLVWLLTDKWQGSGLGAVMLPQERIWTSGEKL